MAKTDIARASALLDRFDPGRSRKARLPRPFIVELTGPSNSGKTTLLDRLYVASKAAGFEAAKVPEGAEAVPPPRVLPDYNFRTADYALEKIRQCALDKNLHLALLDRGPVDAAVRMETFVHDGLLTEAERDVEQAHYLSRFVRANLDLHVWLMVRPDTALARKFGPDHAERAARGELKYSTTTNPAALQVMWDAHQAVWDRLGCANDPRMLWYDTSDRTPEEVFTAVFSALLDAFERRLATL